MTKVVIFNAPPRTGKEVACKHLCKVFSNQSPVHMEFKDELFKVAANILDISVEEFLTDYDRKTPDDVWWMKDLASLSTTSSMKTVGEKKVYSQRDWLIHVSENVIKPSFGKDAFGKMFANSIPEEGFVFCSDGGFKEEIQPVIDKVGADNVLIVQIEREGCNFDNDSRTLLKPEDFDNKVQFLLLSNNFSLEDFKLLSEIVIIPKLQ